MIPSAERLTLDLVSPSAQLQSRRRAEVASSFARRVASSSRRCSRRASPGNINLCRKQQPFIMKHCFTLVSTESKRQYLTTYLCSYFLNTFLSIHTLFKAFILCCIFAIEYNEILCFENFLVELQLARCYRNNKRQKERNTCSVL